MEVLERKEPVFESSRELRKLRYLSLARAMLKRGRQRDWRVPSWSVGARMVRREGKPAAVMDWARMSVAGVKEERISQWR